MSNTMSNATSTMRQMTETEVKAVYERATKAHNEGRFDTARRLNRVSLSGQLRDMLRGMPRVGGDSIVITEVLI